MSEPMVFWTVTVATADIKDIGCGTNAYRSEAEAIESLRSDLIDNYDDMLEGDQTEAEEEEGRQKIRDLSRPDVITAFTEMRNDSDYISAVSVQKHTLYPLDFSTLDKVEKFLS